MIFELVQNFHNTTTAERVRTKRAARPRVGGRREGEVQSARDREEERERERDTYTHVHVHARLAERGGEADGEEIGWKKGRKKEGGSRMHVRG